MERIPDNYDIWLSHDAAIERYKKHLPHCCECGEPIMTEHTYVVRGEYYCEDCMKDMRKDTENLRGVN